MSLDFIKEYTPTCINCGKVLTSEGFRYWKQYGYSENQICNCDNLGIFTAHISIRNSGYGSSFEWFKKAVEIAVSDFKIDTNIINIVHYDGLRYKYTFGIEFIIKNTKEVPFDYDMRITPEFLL